MPRAVTLSLVLAMAMLAAAWEQPLCVPSDYKPYECMQRLKTALLPGLKHNNFEIAGNVLRFAFHDCGTFDRACPDNPNYLVSGCTGGIASTIANNIKAGVFNTDGNPNAQNNGMGKAHTFLVGKDGKSGVCKRVKSHGVCKGMPVADCISFAGYLAVVVTGGAPPGGCPWVPGRHDAPAGSSQNTTRLPPHEVNAYLMREVFRKYNMKGISAKISGFGFCDDTEDARLDRTITVLSGAHTIGRSRDHEKALCSKGLTFLSATPVTFDNDYYKRIVKTVDKVSKYGGHFCSDMHGVCNTIHYKGSTTVSTRRRLRNGGSSTDLTKGYCKGYHDSPFFPYYTEYAAHNDRFKADFCKAYQMMSLIGYDWTSVDDFIAQSQAYKHLLK